MDCQELQVRYWDVFPKHIKVSVNSWGVTIPLSIRGDPTGDPEFESADSSIAWVDGDGQVNLGWQAGSTVIKVYDSDNRDSVRYVQVEVVDQGGGGYGFD